jgi:hypothetical protein
MEYYSNRYVSRGSTVGIATGYGLGDGGISVRVPVAARNLFSSYRPDRLWDTQPTTQWVPAALSPRVKQQGREATH